MDFFGKYKRPKLDEGKMDSVSKRKVPDTFGGSSDRAFHSGRSEARPGEEGTI